MTFVQWQAGDLHAIPGTRLLLYGCALISTSASTTKMVGLLGGLFALLGLIAFWLPESLQIVALVPNSINTRTYSSGVYSPPMAPLSSREGHSCRGNAHTASSYPLVSVPA